MYLSSRAATNEDAYDANGTLANACLPPTWISSVYRGRYTVARVMNNRLATYSIATLDRIVTTVHDGRRSNELPELDDLSAVPPRACSFLRSAVCSRRFAFRKTWKRTVAVTPRLVRIETMVCNAKHRR